MTTHSLLRQDTREPGGKFDMVVVMQRKSLDIYRDVGDFGASMGLLSTDTT